MQVSWVRNADKHILFIGADRFVREDRYELIPSRHGRWTLKLRCEIGLKDRHRTVTRDQSNYAVCS